ncbi:hypothetical protein CCR78_07070 [Rhodovulum imhoffii]|nr:hypothetical protein [Rhodovulum imhoffii]
MITKENRCSGFAPHPSVSEKRQPRGDRWAAIAGVGVANQYVSVPTSRAWRLGDAGLLMR